MSIASFQRWHWMLIGLIAGLACGYVRYTQLDLTTDLEQFGSVIASRRDFEDALVKQLQGRPYFKEIVVYPYRLDDGRSGPQTVHVVAGEYWNGQKTIEDGQEVARWRPACFVAPVPYRAFPRNGSEAEYATIMDYLASQRSAGVTFRYAGWWPYRPLLVWAGAGVGVVGIVWPTLVNLLVFGSVRRPRPTEPVAPAPPPAPASVPVPAAEEAEPAIPEASAGPAKAFGADRDDFYPTELGAKQD